MEAITFSYNLEQNLLEILTELQNGEYRPGRSVAFMVIKPKLREVFAAQFRDRVVHHLLYNYLASIYDKRFIYDSWACRPGKGTHRAVKRLQNFCHQVSDGGAKKDCYYLQMDIKSFFTTIDKKILISIFERNIKNSEVMWLIKVMVNHDPARSIEPIYKSSPRLFNMLPADKSLFSTQFGKGLPIGNLTSQFFANVYMNELDIFVKHQLKVKYYLRYVDDWVIVHNDREILVQYQQIISDFLQARLGLMINPKKTTLRKLSCGVDFLGYVTRTDYLLVRRRVVWQWRKAIDYILSGEDNQKNVLMGYNGHLIVANSHRLRLRHKID